jgi:TrmH family RNA methyltransferase
VNIKEISSPQNVLIRQVIRLSTKSKARRDEGLCVIEGLREVERAVRSGVMIETIFYRPEITDPTVIDRVLIDAPPRPQEARKLLHVHCNDVVFSKIAYRSDVPNVVAIAHRFIRHTLRSQSESTPFVLLLEGIEKPGNLGAILRTADAMGVTGVIMIDCPIELDHPNTIRNSLGAVFSLDIAIMSASEVSTFLKTNQIPLYVTYLNAQSRAPEHLPLDQPCAILLGAESTGVTSRWINDSYGESALIPMVTDRIVDSLNVSVAAAIMMYEVARQRRVQS